MSQSLLQNSWQSDEGSRTSSGKACPWRAKQKQEILTLHWVGICSTENYGPFGNSGLPMGVDLPGGKGIQRGSPRSQGPGGHCREKTHTVPGPSLDLARKMHQWPSVTGWCGEGFDGANLGKRQQRAHSMASNQSLNH